MVIGVVVINIMVKVFMRVVFCSYWVWGMCYFGMLIYCLLGVLLKCCVVLLKLLCNFKLFCVDDEILGL